VSDETPDPGELAIGDHLTGLARDQAGQVPAVKIGHLT
jgi:hypothetical protein